MKEENESVEYKGRIFDGKVSLQAWSIAKRLEPNPDAPRDIVAGLAIAAQIGMNCSATESEKERRLRKKLSDIQEIIDR